MGAPLVPERKLRSMSRVQFVVLAINVVWFLLGFRLFALRPRQAVKLLVPEATRDEMSRRALVDALPFLGGMNFAFAALSGAALTVKLVTGTAPSWTLFFASSVAHATQFACNVPLAMRGGRAGGASWNVLRGPMFFIFVVDASCAVANAAALFV